MFWWILLLSIFLIIMYSFYNIFFTRIYGNNKTKELFESDVENNVPTSWNIKREVVKEFNIDNYTIYDNEDKEIYKTAGKWNLDETNWRLINDKVKINIENKDNKHLFTYGDNVFNEVIYQPDDDKLGNLIINNHEAELAITKIDGNIIFTSTGEDIVVKVENNDDKEYKLIIEDKLYNKYLESFIISFIIFTHIDKELNYKHDN